MATDLSRKTWMAHVQAVQGLQLAFIGLSNNLLQTLDAQGPATPEVLAERARVDAGYVARWCDAAYAFEVLEAEGGVFSLSEMGRACLPDVPGGLMPVAVGSVLGSHMAERAAGLMRSGERPGERVLGERPTILPWFGPMLEAQFAPLFAQHLLPALPVFDAVGVQGGLVLDLGCGNGWYLRTLAAAHPKLRGLGLDGFGENIAQAIARAKEDGMDDRLSFHLGDIHHMKLPVKADAIAMSRALHHVWDQKERVFETLATHLNHGGAVVIWEPAWVAEREALRAPNRKGMALQNLMEHIQGNHFLRPEEIAEQMERVGLVPEVRLFMEGTEAVVVGVKP